MKRKFKICLLGAAAVGKTSVVRRFVRSIFGAKYQTTVGVTIEEKTMVVGNDTVNLVIWDLSGEDEFQRVRLSYLQGASAYLLVVDGTRRSTVETARRLRDAVEEELGSLPFVLVVNKADLKDEWEVSLTGSDPLVRAARRTIRTSAKTGIGIEVAFASIVGACVEEA